MIINRVISLIIERVYKKKGYSSYYVNFYRKEMKNNYKNCDLPAKEKKWAYKNGFNPWRIVQYGLNEDNYKSVISDHDYFYLYPINNRYRAWIDDKLTMKYILSPFDKYLPKYYFHILKERGIMRLMDCKKEYAASVDGIVDLVKNEKILAAKMAAGTYGIGFYRIEYQDGKFFVNEKEYTESDFKCFVKSLDNYIITEYVKMHPEIERLNSCAVNTVRVSVINEHGNDTIIPFAFMRIGTKKSGIVDNVAQGGMVCKINVETGEYYDGEVLKNHVYSPAKIHPDTKAEIRGIIPNWEIVKSELLKMSDYYPQLEWLGYDIAITEDGFKIIEINSHQGLHKAHEYPEELRNYLIKKVVQKKKKYGIIKEDVK